MSEERRREEAETLEETKRDDELSEEELDKVAGGGFAVNTDSRTFGGDPYERGPM